MIKKKMKMALYLKSLHCLVRSNALEPLLSEPIGLSQFSNLQSKDTPLSPRPRVFRHILSACECLLLIHEKMQNNKSCGQKLALCILAAIIAPFAILGIVISFVLRLAILPISLLMSLPRAAIIVHHLNKIRSIIKKCSIDNNNEEIEAYTQRLVNLANAHNAAYSTSMMAHSLLFNFLVFCHVPIAVFLLQNALKGAPSFVDMRLGLTIHLIITLPAFLLTAALSAANLYHFHSVNKRMKEFFSDTINQVLEGGTKKKTSIQAIKPASKEEEMRNQKSDTTNNIDSYVISCISEAHITQRKREDFSLQSYTYASVNLFHFLETVIRAPIAMLATLVAAVVKRMTGIDAKSGQAHLNNFREDYPPKTSEPSTIIASEENTLSYSETPSLP